MAQALKPKFVKYEVKKNQNIIIIIAFEEKKKQLWAYINLHKGKLLNKKYLNKMEAKKACIRDEKKRSKKEKHF